MDAWGITDGYWDVAGDWHPMGEDLRRALAEAVGADGDAPPWTPYWSVTQGDAQQLDSLCEVHLEDGSWLPAMAQLPPDLPVGYHELHPVNGGPATRLVIAPPRCPEPPCTWGWSTQLYALRSRWSWGVGDLGDLRDLLRWTTKLGGGAVLANPLHASTPVVPQQASPYYPSSRRFRNVLYLRIADVPGATLVGPELARLDEEGRALCRLPRLDRDRVLTLKLDALRRIFAVGPEPPGGERFRRWRAGQGVALEQWATYAAIAEVHGPRWPTWPEALRRPDAERACATPPTPSGCGSTRGANGSSTSSSGRRARAAPLPSCRTSRSASRPTGSTRGATRTCSPWGAASAPRRTSSVPRARTGAFRRTSRGSCVRRTSSRSSPPSARRSDTPGGCASITSWASSASTGSRAVPARTAAATSASRPRSCSTSSPWRRAGRVRS